MRKSKRESLNKEEEGSLSEVSTRKLQLPEAPASERGLVKVWEQPVVMRTWDPAEPDRNPMFLEKRVYQGSSGRVYPMPVIDRIATEPRDRVWKALHIENEYVRFMVLPEIGGRIHVGLDKIERIRFFLSPERDQTCACWARWSLDLRRRGIQLAAAPSPRHIHAGGIQH